MSDKLEFLRKLDNIIVPQEYTYLNHCTSFIPSDIKNRCKEGKYIHNWTELPVLDFTVKREMSFVERDDRIKGVLLHRRPLSGASITYQLPDYSKPFIIRVLFPKRQFIRNGIIPVSEEQKKRIEEIYKGGDFRHPKLFNNEKIYIFGYALEDEISNKRVDVFYGICEKDLDLYYKYVVKTLKESYQLDSSVNLDIKDEYGDPVNFYPSSYCIAKTSNISRYISEDGKSIFELELLDDYQDDLKLHGDEMLPVLDSDKYCRLYDDYKANGSKCI